MPKLDFACEAIGKCASVKGVLEILGSKSGGNITISIPALIAIR
jgi:hypothetical protein